jgi:hypothetical protein
MVASAGTIATALDVTKGLQSFRRALTDCEAGGSSGTQKTNSSDLVGRLRVRCEWPRGRQNRDNLDEIASPHARAPRLRSGIVSNEVNALKGPDVRFGSKADMCSAQADVR